jgi:hypothetical protein
MYRVMAPQSCKETAEALEGYLNNILSFEDEVRINWGYSSFKNPKNYTLVKGNSTQSVFNAVNKDVTFKLLKGFVVPAIESKEEFTDTCIQHLDPKGMAGQGVRLIHPYSDKYVEGVPTTKFIDGEEYRVYFAYGEVLGTAKKAKLHDKAHPWVKTPSNGWGYSLFYQEPVTGLFDLFLDGVQEVSKKLDIKYGAIDFIVEKDTCITYILEVNSAPCLFDPELCEKMAASIATNETE